jgi:hypothetical protein
MLKRIITTLATVALLSGAVSAQQPRPQPPTPKPAAPPTTKPMEPPALLPPEPPGQPVNVKLELTITDQTGTGEPTKQVITMIVSDGRAGSIRSKGYQKVPEGGLREIIMNVDARPVIMRNNAVRIELGLEYSPTAAAPTGTASEGRSNLNQRITFMIDPGKPLVVSQAVDPLSNSRITVEVRATIMK